MSARQEIAEHIAKILVKLYKPNVGRGNYQADVFNRGRNAALLDVADSFGVKEEYEAATSLADKEQDERMEAVLERVSAERREG